MPFAKMTSEQYGEIDAAFETGESARDVATRVNCHKGTVERHWRLKRMERGPQPPKPATPVRCAVPTFGELRNHRGVTLPWVTIIRERYV